MTHATIDISPGRLTISQPWYSRSLLAAAVATLLVSVGFFVAMILVGRVGRHASGLVLAFALLLIALFCLGFAIRLWKIITLRPVPRSLTATPGRLEYCDPLYTGPTPTTRTGDALRDVRCDVRSRRDGSIAFDVVVFHSKSAAAVVPFTLASAEDATRVATALQQLLSSPAT